MLSKLKVGEFLRKELRDEEEESGKGIRAYPEKLFQSATIPPRFV